MNAFIKLAAAGVFAAAFACFADDAQTFVKDGQKLAFLGDSITQFGANHEGGYVKLVVSGLAANGIKVEPVFAGISGNKSNDMLARVEKDVIAKKPDVMTLSCGVNDVMHGANGVELEPYKKNISELVDKVQGAGIKVVILTATMIGEDAANANNQKLAAYNDFLRELAKERKLPLADLNEAMQEAKKKAQESGAPMFKKNLHLTCDGVHMGPAGDLLMAEGVLRALGLNDEQIAKAKAAWLEIPASMIVPGAGTVSLPGYERIAAQAAAEKLSVKEFLDKKLGEALTESVSK